MSQSRKVSLPGMLALGFGLGMADLPFGTKGSRVTSAADAQLFGAGATFPAPLYVQWFHDYHNAHPDVTIDYQGICSGAGIKQFTAGTTDFGAKVTAMPPRATL